MKQSTIVLSQLFQVGEKVISCCLVFRYQQQGMFSVDPEKGSIIVSGTLDREEQQAYTLIVEAWDNYKYGYAAGESRNAFQQVT